MISEGENGWEDMLPDGVPDIIKEHRLIWLIREGDLPLKNK